uniref:HECT domain-containing protein n=1 Tax=Steinernema glaseri TaxID=37863 RepID=A0A1I7ZT04_9BILA
MDGVPIAFWTHLCDILRPPEITEAKELSGNVGELTETSFHQIVHYAVLVQNGFVQKRFLLYCCSDREEHTPQEI